MTGRMDPVLQRKVLFLVVAAAGVMVAAAAHQHVTSSAAAAFAAMNLTAALPRAKKARKRYRTQDDITTGARRRHLDTSTNYTYHRTVSTFIL